VHLFIIYDDRIFQQLIEKFWRKNESVQGNTTKTIDLNSALIAKLPITFCGAKYDS